MKSKLIFSSKPIASAEAVNQFRRTRWNPLRHLSPESIARALESFEYGDLAFFCEIAEAVADRDDTIKGVKAKREKSVSSRPWTVLLHNESGEAQRHREVLNDFWNRVRAVNAYDRNERGGIGRLIRQMMSSASYRYAAHHLVWQTSGRQLSALFEFVPLGLFNNTTGNLRFIKAGHMGTPEALAEKEWMVTKGDGLMIPGLVAYAAKRFAIQDWLAFSEKFSMPGILGATTAAKGTQEGMAMKAAVEAFAQDWSAVMYGVTDPTKPPIHLIQPNGNPSAMPMPALVERVDRRLATLWCGADLSTMSSTSGSGSGASLQAGDALILLTDDCETISEALRQVERTVIAWHFGEGTEPQAYFKLMPPAASDRRQQLALITGLVGAGARIGKGDAAARLGFRLAKESERAFGDA